jgi:hypothetical protein
MLNFLIPRLSPSGYQRQAPYTANSRNRIWKSTDQQEKLIGADRSVVIRHIHLKKFREILMTKDTTPTSQSSGDYIWVYAFFRSATLLVTDLLD